MSEFNVTVILVALLAFSIWAMVRGVRSAKIKKTGSTLIVAVMFGFAKLLDPKQVAIEEARQNAPRKRQGQNGKNLDKETASGT